MNRKSKAAMILLVLFCLSQSVVCYGNEETFRNNADYMQTYYTQEDDLFLLISAGRIQAEEGECASPEQFTAKLGQTDLAVESVKRADDQPVTYYCLVDISGSVKGEQFEMEKAALRSLCDALQEGDRMVIARMGDAIDPSPYLSDPAELLALIDSLTVTDQDTNLYKGIIDGLTALSTSDSVTQHKALVVLSDGEDYQRDGKTRSEADKAILDTKIPVFTMAVMTAAKAGNATWQEYAKELGSFARESTGGVTYNPSFDEGVSAAGVGTAIADAMHNDLVVKMRLPDTSEVSTESGTILLTVRYRTGNGDTLDDAMTLYTRDLSVSVQESDTPSEPPEPDHTKWIILIAVLTLLLAGISIGVYRMKKRTVPVEQQTGESEEDCQKEAASREGSGLEEAGAAIKNETLYSMPADIPGREEDSLDEIFSNSKAYSKVVFTVIGHDKLQFVLMIEKGRQCTVGRNQKSDLVLNPEDKRLSSIHFTVMCQEDFMLIRDAGSTNGTVVNNVSLDSGQTIKLEDGGTIHVGNYTYRVQFLGDVIQ